MGYEFKGEERGGQTQGGSQACEQRTMENICVWGMPPRRVHQEDKRYAADAHETLSRPKAGLGSLV